MNQGTSYGNISFANSFAQFPPARSSNYESNTVEASTVDMSLDALFMHEIHHIEVSSVFGEGRIRDIMQALH